MSMPLARRVPRPSTGSGRAPAVRLARSVVIGVIIPEGPGRVPRWVRQGQRRATTGGRPYGEGLWLRPARGFAARQGVDKRGGAAIMAQTEQAFESRARGMDPAPTRI